MTSLSIHNLTQKPRTDPNHVAVDWPLTLTWICWLRLLRWPLTKSQNFRKGLSCSIFCIDFDFGLCFFIWNSEISQLAHSSLWFLQRHSPSNLFMLMKPTPQTCSTTSHNQNVGTQPPTVSTLAAICDNVFGASPMCRRNSRCPGRIMITHAA